MSWVHRDIRLKEMFISFIGRERLKTKFVYRSRNSTEYEYITMRWLFTCSLSRSSIHRYKNNVRTNKEKGTNIKYNKRTFDSNIKTDVQRIDMAY